MRHHDFLVRKFKEMTGKADMARLQKKTPFQGVATVCNIPYLDDKNEYHLLDVYYPEGNTGKLPVIIDIHGGGWMYGTKEINKHYCMGLAKEGFIVVNPSYRLLPEGRYPGIIEDVFAVYDWALKNLEQYNGDLNNIFLTGDSAGAHLAALSMCILTNPEYKEKLNVKTDITFRAAALTCGVFDLEGYYKIKLPVLRHIFKMMLGDDYKTNEHRRYLSIKNHALEKLPPLFLNSAFADFMRFQVKKFTRELDKRGIQYKYKYFAKKDSKHTLLHVYNILFPEWEESIATTSEMLTFFRSHLVK